MEDLCGDSSYECLCPADSLRRLTLADALEAVVSIKPKLEGPIEILSEQGRIAFASSDEFGNKGSLQSRMTPLRALYPYMGQGCLGGPKHRVVRPAGSRLVQLSLYTDLRCL